MKATELLEKQHRLVAQLFSRFEAAEAGPAKKKIFEELAANLVAHDAIEREIFYPACEKAFGAEEDVLRESLVEHGVVEFCLFRADKKAGTKDFDKYVTVLKEMVEHHVDEEEDELLPKVQRAMSGELEALGARMEARFAEALRSDFRAPLVQNLRQVLAGRTKTQPKPARSTAKARTKSTRPSGATGPKRRAARHAR